ncbi:DUF397 domain-containing protein [Streptomyces hygroscopicus]|uniref:DUF397 domain-containing protein n=1 Tax=Streptomyces hygroscopicus TaxID=1912 RepID=UPI0036C7762C
MNTERASHGAALRWRKSSYSGSGGGDCVEMAETRGAIYVRDSKYPEGPVLTLTAASWEAFLPYVGLGPDC